MFAAAIADCMNVEAQTKKLQPDVILMDIDLPGLNGIEAVKKIRHFNKDVQVIMLTIFHDDEHFLPRCIRLPMAIC